MIHKILPVGPLQCNCSIIGDETTREAMVIDPGDNIEDVLAIVRQHNLVVKQIVITHAHIDHVGGAMKLRAQTGAPILLNHPPLVALDFFNGFVERIYLGTSDGNLAWIDDGSPVSMKLEVGSALYQRLSVGTLVQVNWSPRRRSLNSLTLAPAAAGGNAGSVPA